MTVGSKKRFSDKLIMSITKRAALGGSFFYLRNLVFATASAYLVGQQEIAFILVPRVSCLTSNPIPRITLPLIRNTMGKGGVADGRVTGKGRLYAGRVGRD